MLILTFLFKTIIDLYIMVFLLLTWMQWAHCDFYNPFSQVVIKITQNIIGPLRRIFLPIERFDGVALLLALILAMIKFPLLILMEMRMIVIEPMHLLIGLIVLLKAMGQLIFWVIIIHSLPSWISKGYSPIDSVLYQLSEPLMSTIRRFLPRMGGIDFSAMIIILILCALNYLGIDLYPEIWHQL